MINYFRKVLFLYLINTLIYSQPDSRFRPFDWTVYKGSGSINSFTEGFTFVYIGTRDGGVKRFNLFSNYFESPITMAQGLKSDKIDALHFDISTGLLWVANPGFVQYSFSREGDWFSISLDNLGLSQLDEIRQIGSSKDYVWLKARSSFAKINQSSGSLVGVFSLPDEMNISWSSSRSTYDDDMSELIINYAFLDGWHYSGNNLIDALGRTSKISTSYIGRHGDVFIGSDKGDIFYGTTTLQTFTHIVPDIENIDVMAISDFGDELWIASYNYIYSKGISKLYKNTLASEIFRFEQTINMAPTPIYSLFANDEELWAGGESAILYYDLVDDYWRTLDQTRGIPFGKITDIEKNDNKLWIASSNGLARMDSEIFREDPSGIESYFSGITVHDIEIYGQMIWLGTSRGVFIYDSNDSKILRLEDIATKNFPENFYNVNLISEYNHIIYMNSEIGIIQFDLIEKELKIAFSSVIYSNKIVLSMAVNEKFIFLGTTSGLVKINKKNGFVRDYNFSFLSRINDMLIDRNDLWLGTSAGLVKYKWKRNL